jgi:hypothetical protein
MVPEPKSFVRPRGEAPNQTTAARCMRLLGLGERLCSPLPRAFGCTKSSLSLSYTSRSGTIMIVLYGNTWMCLVFEIIKLLCDADAEDIHIICDL